MELTKEQIEKINRDCPNSDMGVYLEPTGIPYEIKDYVIYMRWITGGVTGGSCWGGELRHYEGDPEPDFVALELVLNELKPNLTFLQYRKIERELIHTNEEGDRTDYYGNRDDYMVKYVILPELINYLETLD